MANNMNMNPMQIMAMLRNGGNPQQMILQMLESQSKNNPILQNLLSEAKAGNTKGIEQIARNLSKERGIDFDKEFNEFKRALGVR